MYIYIYITPAQLTICIERVRETMIKKRQCYRAQHVVLQSVHVSRNVKEMGEVSRIRADPTNSKYEKKHTSTIERLFDVWPTLINVKSEKNNEKKVSQDDNNVTENKYQTTKDSENVVSTDDHPISGFRHEDGGPLSKNPQKFHQKHVPCTVVERNCGSGTEPATTPAENEASAEDSSYDSDDGSVSSSYSSQLEATEPMSVSHTDVSRTVSDTLAAEFADYVTMQPLHHKESAYSQKSPGYIARVEFALKLGYTERLVQAALLKLGPEPGQDELLAELIKLGASPAKLSDNPEDTGNGLGLQSVEAEPNSEEISVPVGPNTGILLRPVVIDGSNVAMSHGNKELFSCRGIKICVEWFRARGHREITVFVPKWRKESSRPDNPIADQEILGELERDRLLVFTPSRLINGKRLVCYDDRYILRLAVELDGIVVSNDNYRDLAQENPEFRRIVEERLLMYSFVNDRFMPPDDPLGRGGPTLDNFLKISPKRASNLPCPYAKKCTYGNKCKFRHPERGEIPQKSVTEQLVEHAQRHLRARGPSLSLPLPSSATIAPTSIHRPLCRTQSASLPHSSKSPSPNQSMGNEVTNTAAGPYNKKFINWPESRMKHSESEASNMHKKLQRQLTLNPNCDLRLYHLKRQHYYQQKTSVPNQITPQAQFDSGSRKNIHQRPPTSDNNNNKNSICKSKKDSNSNEPSNVGLSEYPGHKHVTRMASAPDSTLGWLPRPPLPAHPSSSSSQNGRQRLGMSDPQLNLLPYPATLHSCVSPDTQIYDARRRLHYHLSNIFPDEQVQVAMALHPHETDPQQICATILALFPKP